MYEGREAVTREYVSGLERVAKFGDAVNGGAPTLIGEFGIPFDLNGARAYSRWSEGNHSPNIWQAHICALTAMYDALDTLLLSSTQWNYTASNGNDPMIGDGWNQEDLSIWSADQVLHKSGSNPDAGARALEGFCRPFVRAAQGELLNQSWDGLAVFECSIDIDENIISPTEIFVPTEYTVCAVHRGKTACVWQQHDSVISLMEKSFERPTRFTVQLRKTVVNE